jgi:CRP-like cAMP-binding protein
LKNSFITFESVQHTYILENINKLIPLTSEEQEIFTAFLKEKTLAKKEFLLRAGEVCKYETFVVKGCLRNYYIDNNGNEHTTLFAIESWWTGDLYSFITQNPSRYFIEALEDTIVLQISHPDMERIYSKIPKFERLFRILLQNAYVAQEQRIVQNLSNSAEQRYKAFALKYPTLEQRIAQKHIASYLGITPEFLSMLRRKAAGK